MTIVFTSITSIRWIVIQRIYTAYSGVPVLAYQLCSNLPTLDFRKVIRNQILCYSVFKSMKEPMGEGDFFFEEVVIYRTLISKLIYCKRAVSLTTMSTGGVNITIKKKLRSSPASDRSSVASDGYHTRNSSYASRRQDQRPPTFRVPRTPWRREVPNISWTTRYGQGQPQRFSFAYFLWMDGAWYPNAWLSVIYTLLSSNKLTSLEPSSELPYISDRRRGRGIVTWRYMKPTTGYIYSWDMMVIVGARCCDSQDTDKSLCIFHVASTSYQTNLEILVSWCDEIP
jgi:hypothetical protein